MPESCSFPGAWDMYVPPCSDEPDGVHRNLTHVALPASALVGLLIIWSANFTITLGFLVDTFAEAESAVTAVERVESMARLPSERPMMTDSAHTVPPSWPSDGHLEFRDVCLRYREGLPLALDKLSINIPPGKSVGVVGRTGAGTKRCRISRIFYR